MKINCADAITIITGNLTVSVERLYTLYNELTGDNLYTHQLPRAGRAVEPHARRQFPELSEALKSRPIDTSNWTSVVAEMRGRFGDEFHIDPLTDWQTINPLSELESMVSPNQTIVVCQDSDSPNPTVRTDGWVNR